MRPVLSAFLLLPFLAVAAAADSLEDLYRVLRVPDVIAVMRDEGIAYGDDLEAEMFPGSGGARWDTLVQTIYDPIAMQRHFEAAFDPGIRAETEVLAEALDFFSGERGQRIVAMEIAARAALLEASVEEAARQRVDEMRRADDPRLSVITRFAEVNDLIERNVAGALNASIAFYRGMIAGGAFPDGLGEGEMLANVWSQEEAIRSDMEEWLFPFLTLAYDPLSDDDLAAYIEFSETRSGQVLNAALFAGFEAVFETISADLGRAAALMMSGEDL